MKEERRILFVSRYLAVENITGSDAYVAAVLRCLARAGFKVDYLWLGLTPFHKIWHRLPPRVASADRYETPYSVKLGPFRAPRDPALWLWIMLKRLWNFCGRIPGAKTWNGYRKTGTWLEEKFDSYQARFGWDSFPEPVDFVAFDKVLERLQPDVVIANYYLLAPLLDHIRPPAAGKVVLTHNGRHGHVTEATELACLQKADLLLAIQEDDLRQFHEQFPGKDVALFSMPLLPKPAKRRPIPNRLLFVGAAHPSNLEGLRWFLDAVWPLIRARCPGVQFHVCGNVNKGFPDPVADVHFRGRVEDLDPEYDEASLVLVPLQGGTGLKIKLVEALQHGRPVVATSYGLQGLSFIEGRCAIRADTAEDFAAAVHRLLTNEPERRKLEDQTLLVVEEYFSPQACTQPFLQWWKQRNRSAVASLAVK